MEKFINNKSFSNEDMYVNDFPDYCNTLVKIKATVVGIIFFEDNKIEKLKAYYKGYVDYKSKKRGRSYE